MIINYKTYTIENKSKSSLIESSLLANKNEAGPSKLNKTKPISKSMKLQRTSSSDKPKGSLKIEIEGRNPSASILENLEEYRNSLARSNPLPDNLEDLTKLTKQKANKQQQNQKLIKTLKGPLPFIEVKGTKLDNQQNEDMIIDYTATNNSVLSRKQPDSHTTLNSLEHSSGEETLFRRNLNPIDQNNLTLNDAFNVSSMLNTKPYQLSKINSKKANNDNKKTDFYLNDDEFENDNNFNNNFAQSHNSFTSNSYNYYSSMQKLPKKFDNETSNDSKKIVNSELDKIESVNYFDSNITNNSSEKFIKNNNIVFPDDMLNVGKKPTPSNETTAKKPVKKLIHPPVKKPARTNTEYGAELMQANLPLVGVKTKIEENFRVSNQNYISNENLNDSTKS